MNARIWPALLAVWAATTEGASPAAGAAASAAAPSVALKLTNATLSEALHALLVPRGIGYLVLAGRAERRDTSVTAASMPEAVQQVLGLYQAEGVYLGTIVIANGGPPTPPLAETWRDLLASVPERKRPARDELVRALLDHYADVGGDQLPEPARGQVTLLPFAITQREMLEAVRGWLVESERAACASFAEAVENNERLEGKLVLEEGDAKVRQLELSRDTPWGEQRFVIGGVEFALLEASTDPWQTHWKPHAAATQAYRSPSLLLPVNLDARHIGTVGSLLRLLGRSVPARFEAPEELARLPVAAWLPDAPVWSVLEALTIASGWRWGPEEDSTRYAFSLPQTLRGRLFSRVAPERRAVALLWPGKHYPFFVVQAWRHLSDAQRALLLQGGRFPVEEAGSLARHWMHLGQIAVSDTIMQGALARLEGASYRLAMVEGFYALHSSGVLRAVLRTGTDPEYSLLLRGNANLLKEHTWAGGGADRGGILAYRHRGGADAPVGTRMGREFNARLVGQSP